ncbi:MAG TPA: SprT family zinc-dependent metalloprotease [Xanthobacteraceae bacterium]|nr:SprT family zinc-dependent metalloprotease [Xanthobacteraceae bacterium]
MPLSFRFFRKQPPPARERFIIGGGGEHYAIEVRRHPAARRYTLRVREATRDIVLTMPPRGSLQQAKRFAEKNTGWIAARLKRLPQPAPFLPGEIIPLRGAPHRIVHRANARGTAWTEAGADGTPLLCVAGGSAHIGRRVRDFLKREAQRDLVAASRRYAATLGVSIRAVSLRDTASRWGSCSQSGSLSFSWRLVLAPPFVLDYLAAHEVAHRIELNHSKRFWRTVEKIFPEWRRAEAWLRAHGASLYRYGIE